jgi:ATP-binding cassette, subfamily B, bacterial
MRPTPRKAARTPQTATPRKVTDRKLIGRILREARPFRWRVGGIFATDLLGTPVLLLTPIPLKIVVDNVVGDQPLPGIVTALLPRMLTDSTMGVLVLAVLLQVVVVALAQLQAHSLYVQQLATGERMTLQFQARLFAHVQRLSFNFHDRRGTADSIYRIKYDAPSLQWVTIFGVLPLISAGVMLVSMVVVLAAMEWRLALIALVVCPVLLVLFDYYRKRVRGRYKEAKELESSALAIVQEVITAVRVVKAFGREDAEQERFVSKSTEGLQVRVRLAIREGLFAAGVAVTTATGTALVLYVGVRSVLGGTLTVGALLVALTYVANVYKPLQQISKQLAALQENLASAERAFSLLDETPDPIDRPDAVAVDRVSGHIEVRDASFEYEAGRPVLEDISLEILPGERIGMRGRTGAGKTTLLSLIVRFVDPTNGVVLLDGKDIRDYRLADVREQFAIVLQEPVLFSSTIADNIAYARPGATHEEIVAAATAANAHDFIAALPDGYATKVGERGMTLSGGERQRLSLARAFLRDAPILILDEPTSSVDVGTEAQIMDAMFRLMEGRTTIMIAHRLSTLEHCDRTVHLQAGRIVDTVIHAERMSAPTRVGGLVDR